MMDLKVFLGYFEEVLRNYVVENLLYLAIKPFPPHIPPFSLTKNETIQNYSHFGFPRPNMDILRMEDRKNPAKNIATLIAARPEK